MMVLALAVFFVVLFVFATDMAHRTPAALAGAVVLVIAGAIGQEEAIEAVHWETLGLLVGMMILVGILKDSGVFPGGRREAGARPDLSRGDNRIALRLSGQRHHRAADVPRDARDRPDS